MTQYQIKPPAMYICTIHLKSNVSNIADGMAVEVEPSHIFFFVQNEQYLWHGSAYKALNSSMWKIIVIVGTCLWVAIPVFISLNHEMNNN